MRKTSEAVPQSKPHVSAHLWRITDDFPKDLPIFPSELKILLNGLPNDLLNELVNSMPCAIIDEGIQERIGK
jgi:hypothetical protein